MIVATGIRRSASLWLIASAFLVGPAPAGANDEGMAAPEGGAPLRWTPHRSAATPGPLVPGGDTAAGQAPAEPRQSPEDQAQPQPTAPARLAPVPPADVRPGTPAARAPRAAQAPAQASRTGRASPRPLPPQAEAPAPWESANRTAGTSRGTVRREESVAPGDSLFGINLFRAPQGDQGRPMFGAERVPQRDGVRPAAAAGSDPLRFSPRQVGAAADRLAMQAEGNPAMMSRRTGSSMPTTSMPRPRVPARRVANQPTPAGELPPPVDGVTDLDAPSRSATPPSRAGRPTPAGEYPSDSMITDSMPMDEGGLAFGGPDGEIGYGDMPTPMGDGEFLDSGLGGFPEEGMIYGDDGMTGPWMGDVQLHIPSFYDDPYACEDEDNVPMWDHDGRFLAWVRRFGRPYYGWRWYRDFTASAGVTSFQASPDLGLHGNFGFNEYANWSMPFWNAFGVGWQVGVRAVQADFQPTQVTAANGSVLFNNQSRNQVFLTTGFFTRAFEGRGLQGGAVYDYLRDNWYDTADLSQVRGELSYVWGYHEFGFWGAFNTMNTNGIFVNGAKPNSAYHDTLDLYTGFYRLQFGDANELKIWGGASGQGDNLLGALVRAPMSRSLALEGTFTYLIPRTSNKVSLPVSGSSVTYSEQAWNMSANIVWYPAFRARRSLASPYRPLFDVADNGSMIRSLTVAGR
jgi:hypothetical protein